MYLNECKNYEVFPIEVYNYLHPLSVKIKKFINSYNVALKTIPLSEDKLSELLEDPILKMVNLSEYERELKNLVKRYCICNYHEYDSMIQCDFCQKWYHVKCLDYLSSIYGLYIPSNEFDNLFKLYYDFTSASCNIFNGESENPQTTENKPQNIESPKIDSKQLMCPNCLVSEEIMKIGPNRAYEEDI